MLHRIGVRNPSRISANQNMVIQVDELSDFVCSARKNGYVFLSLDEFIDELEMKRVPKKAFVLTFDDGYLDNFNCAFPALKAISAPFCVYISTGFIGTHIIPWWYNLEYVLSSVNVLRAPNGKEYFIDTNFARNSAFLDIRKGFMQSQASFAEYYDWLESLCEKLLIPYERLFMSWEEVGILSQSNLVTIGAHTHRHPVLSGLDPELAFDEMHLSKRILSDKLATKINHFSFPFGGKTDYSQREAHYAEKLEFRSAVSTNFGAIRRSDCLNLHSLPRVFYGPGLTLSGLKFNLCKAEFKQLIKALLKKGGAV